MKTEPSWFAWRRLDARHGTWFHCLHALTFSSGEFWRTQNFGFVVPLTCGAESLAIAPNYIRFLELQHHPFNTTLIGGRSRRIPEAGADCDR